MSLSLLNVHTKNVIQICCLPLALFTNISLIVLICTKSPSKLGTYKYLMIFFAVVSTGYSIVEAVANPLLLSHKDCFQVVCDVQFEDPRVDRNILYYGCGFCGVIMSMFVIHFVYRFFAIERRGKLKYFDNWYLVIWLLIPLSTGFTWAQSLFVFLGEDEESSEYMREVLYQTYSLNISKVVYVGVLYWKKDGIGQEYLNIKGLEGVAVLGTIMTICFIFIAVFGSLTYTRIKLLILHGRSEFTKRLQKQLYHALVIQTMIPIVFMILPLSLYFFSPLFHLGCQVIGDITTLTIVIYPIIDPLPVIFIIDNYRNALFRLIGLKVKRREVNSSSSNT